MSATGLDVFDKTLQTTHIWLDELMEEIGPDRQVAWHVLGAVLRAVRDRVPLELAVHLGAQLPLLIRGTYYDQWSSPRSDRQVAHAGGVPGADRARVGEHAAGERAPCGPGRIWDPLAARRSRPGREDQALAPGGCSGELA